MDVGEAGLFQRRLERAAVAEGLDAPAGSPLVHELLLFRGITIASGEEVRQDQPAAGLEHAIGLAHEIGLVLGVADRFHCPDHVEAGIGIAGGGEVAPLEVHLVGHLVALRIFVCFINLVGGDGDTGDPRTLFPRQPDGAAAHAAAGIEHGVLRRDAGALGQNLVFPQQGVRDSLGGFVPIAKVQGHAAVQPP